MPRIAREEEKGEDENDADEGERAAATPGTHRRIHRKQRDHHLIDVVIKRAEALGSQES